MITRRSESEIAILRQANRIVSDTLVALAAMVEPGTTTAALDAVAEERIRKAGAVPSFLGYRGFPKSVCVSVDDEIVHGIPGSRKLKTGEIVSLDVGAFYQGYHGDAAVTVPCGKIDKVRKRLMKATERALACGIAAARVGNHLSDVSRAIQGTVETAGFSIVRAFVGHGIGVDLHEEPQIPNYVTRRRGPRLAEGMVLAIEPMVNAGVAEVVVREDGWTAVTADGRPSAHFEHSVVVRSDSAEILSASETLVWGRLVEPATLE